MDATYSIPGVYRQRRERAEGFPRVRTDVAGFVGIAGPRHVGEAVAVDDWRSYLALFHEGNGDPPPGAMLHETLRSYFANGGRRAWVVNCAEAVDAELAHAQMNTMLGIGPNPQPHGLELLLRQDEVSIVVLPELDALRTVQEPVEQEQAPGNPHFVPCACTGTRGPGARRTPPPRPLARLYEDDEVLWAQQQVILRLQREPWRWIALFAPPPGRSAERAVQWRRRLTTVSPGTSVAALYWPWILRQHAPGEPLELRSPVGALAGIYAATDIDRGPHAAPANRRVEDAVDLQPPGVEDEDNRLAYDAGVNVLRDFPSRGVMVWGARTVLWGEGDEGDVLRFVNARRCLSAIARTAEVVARPLVFQPNDAMLRIRLHQMLTDYLLRVFATGALAGEVPEEGFFVEVETVEDSPEGHLVCNIGVALAAPAEFIVFRLGRDGGVVEWGEPR